MLKPLAVLLCLGLVGCATSKPSKPANYGLEALKNLTRNCETAFRYQKCGMGQTSCTYFEKEKQEFVSNCFMNNVGDIDRCISFDKTMQTLEAMDYEILENKLKVEAEECSN